MSLNEALAQKNITKYRLWKESGVPQATISDICTGKTNIEKCSAETIYRIAKVLDVSMESLIAPAVRSLDEERRRPSFEVFKSNVGHEVQELGQLNFLEKYLIGNEVETLWEYNKLNALYLVAMIDYVSRINGISLCSKYDKYRSYKLKEEIYPSSYYVHKKVVSSYKMENIIAEFERFGIIEGDVFNVQ